MAFPPLVNPGETIVSSWGRSVVGALPQIGTIDMWAGDTNPTDWLLCRGQAVSRTTYAELYTLVKIGSGSTERGRFDLAGDAVGTAAPTFRVPDLRGRYPFGHNVSGSYGQLGVGQVFGNKDSIGLPAHSHTVPDHLHGVNINTGNESAWHQHYNDWGELYQQWPYPADNIDSFDIGLGGGITITIHKFPTGSGNPSSNQTAFHIHNVSGNTGGSGVLTASTASADVTNANLPPSVSLNFIIRAA